MWFSPWGMKSPLSVFAWPIFSATLRSRSSFPLSCHSWKKSTLSVSSSKFGGRFSCRNGHRIGLQEISISAQMLTGRSSVWADVLVCLSWVLCQISPVASLWRTGSLCTDTGSISPSRLSTLQQGGFCCPTAPDLPSNKTGKCVKFALLFFALRCQPPGGQVDLCGWPQVAPWETVPCPVHYHATQWGELYCILSAGAQLNGPRVGLTLKAPKATSVLKQGRSGLHQCRDGKSLPLHDGPWAWREGTWGSHLVESEQVWVWSLWETSGDSNPLSRSLVRFPS